MAVAHAAPADDWPDETPAEVTPVEAATVPQMLPAAKRAIRFVFTALGGLLLLLLGSLWLFT